MVDLNHGSKAVYAPEAQQTVGERINSLIDRRYSIVMRNRNRAATLVAAGSASRAPASWCTR